MTTRHRGLLLPWLLPAVWLLTGCIALPIPHQLLLTPLYSGTMTDATTGVPITGAQVEATGISNKMVQTERTATDSAGHYKIGLSTQVRWTLLWMVPADGICAATLTITAPGYETFSKKFAATGWAGGYGPCAGRIQNEAIALQPPAS